MKSNVTYIANLFRIAPKEAKITLREQGKIHVYALASIPPLIIKLTFPRKGPQHPLWQVQLINWDGEILGESLLTLEPALALSLLRIWRYGPSPKIFSLRGTCLIDRTGPSEHSGFDTTQVVEGKVRFSVLIIRVSVCESLDWQLEEFRREINERGGRWNVGKVYYCARWQW